MSDPPLLVFGPWSTEYDFGPRHPLTPRRFGPGMDLLAALGGEPGLAPEPAPDDELLACHTRRYVETVRRFSRFEHEGWAEPEAGIGPGDCPAFHDMHEASAAVAGGSLRAIEAILRGDVEHAFQPGGGLHHAMPSRASGFCIYNDPALAIARARRAGLRVLYVDVDVHHGDGVEAIHAADPGVLTVSVHETGRYLFPGTGFAGDVGEGIAAGSVVNLPLEPETGEAAWLPAVTALVPELAAAFGPDVVVSQHGADSHWLDPLAHLLVTTTAMGAAARLVDAVAHRRAGGRWLATGGGGYGVYRVVPRAWAHVWLAGAHREVPDRLPGEWRERWTAEATRYGELPLPDTFDDPPNMGRPVAAAQADAEARSLDVAALVRRLVVPSLVREAADRGWWSPLGGAAGPAGAPLDGADEEAGAPTIIGAPARDLLERLEIAPRLVANLDAEDVRAILRGPGLELTIAVAGGRLVGLVASAAAADEPGLRDLLAVGVTPGARRRGIAGALLRAHVAADGPGLRRRAEIGVAERDPVEPLDRSIRADVGRRLLAGAGFAVGPARGPIARLDPLALEGRRG